MHDAVCGTRCLPSQYAAALRGFTYSITLGVVLRAARENPGSLSGLLKEASMASDLIGPAAVRSVVKFASRMQTLNRASTITLPAGHKGSNYGASYDHGLNSGTRARAKSTESRVTTVRPWCRPVAAMIKSGCEKV